jgi:hypothetical protein
MKLRGGEQIAPVRAAQVMSHGGGGNLEVVVSYHGSMQQTGLTPQQLKDIRFEVRTRGGGSVQHAFGS